MLYRFSEEELDRTLGGLYKDEPFTDRELAEFFVSGWDREACRMHEWINGWVLEISGPEMNSAEDAEYYGTQHFSGCIQWWEPLPYATGKKNPYLHGEVGEANLWWDSIEVNSSWMEDSWSKAPSNLDELLGRLSVLIDLPAYAWPAHVKERQFDLNWRDENSSLSKRMTFYGLPGFQRKKESGKDRVLRL